MIPQSLRENKPKILRRLTFFGIFSAVALVQNIGLLPEIVGLRFLPLLPLTVAVSMFERETYGLNFGLLAGVLCDLNIGRADGAHALFFALMGFVCGLLMDMSYGELLGYYALIYMIIGYVNGMIGHLFYQEFLNMPLLLCILSDLIYNIYIYVFGFLMHGKLSIPAYVNRIVVPEVVYTAVLALVLYKVILMLNDRFEEMEKKNAKRFI